MCFVYHRLHYQLASSELMISRKIEEGHRKEAPLLDERRKKSSMDGLGAQDTKGQFLVSAVALQSYPRHMHMALTEQALTT